MAKSREKYFIDTNIFLRFFAPSKKKFADECEDVFKKVRNREIKAITSDLVLAEIVLALNSFYDFKRSKIAKAAEAVVNMKGLSFSNKVERGRGVRIFSKNKVKFIDALISSHPEINSGKVKIVSYDKDFDEIGVERVEPKELI